MQIEDGVQRVLSRIQSPGCAHTHLVPFATELIESGYSVLSARDFLRAAAPAAFLAAPTLVMRSSVIC